jgi:hypothetical protein
MNFHEKILNFQSSLFSWLKNSLVSLDVKNSLDMHCKAFSLAGGKSRDPSLKFVVFCRHFDFS